MNVRVCHESTNEEIGVFFFPFVSWPTTCMNNIKISMHSNLKQNKKLHVISEVLKLFPEEKKKSFDE